MEITIKIGLKYTFIPLQQEVEIVWETLEPGGINHESAMVTVEGRTHTPYTFPVALAEKYLTTDPPKLPGKATPIKQ